MAELLAQQHPKQLVRDRKKQNFDPVARLYRWAEYLLLGPLLRRAREHFIPVTVGAREMLVLGDGDGRYLAKYLLCSPDTRALAVDGSASMLRLLWKRCRFAQQRLHLWQGDFTALPQDLNLSRFDLVVSHFALDCVSADELKRLVGRLSSHLPAGSRWLVSDFGIPSREPWRTLARAYVRTLYLLFRVLTGLRTQKLPDVQRALEFHGFRRLQRSEWVQGLLYSEIWELRCPVVASSEAHFAQLPSHTGHPPF